MNFNQLTFKVDNDGATPDGKLSAEEYNALLLRVQQLSEGATYGGIVRPASNPISIEPPVFYVAMSAGTYTNFGSLIVADGEVAILQIVGNAWTKTTLINKGEFMAATPSGSPQHELYTSVGAKWNGTTGYWEFNGINNMTNADMAKSLALANMISNPIVQIGQYALMSFRTNVWNRNIRSSVEVCFSEAFRNNPLLEVLDFRTNYSGFKLTAKNLSYCFYGCPKLRSILGEIDVRNIAQISSNTFDSPLLEEVYLFHAKGNVDISSSPVFKKECLLYMIENAIPATAITITVHADVYAWASTDAEVQAALAAQPLITLISA